jgi:hypothetical protein
MAVSKQECNEWRKVTPAVMLGARPFILDAPREWRLAIGNKLVVTEGKPEGDRYRVRLRPMTAKERRR